MCTYLHTTSSNIQLKMTKNKQNYLSENIHFPFVFLPAISQGQGMQAFLFLLWFSESEIMHVLIKKYTVMLKTGEKQ